MGTHRILPLSALINSPFAHPMIALKLSRPSKYLTGEGFDVPASAEVGAAGFAEAPVNAVRRVSRVLQRSEVSLQWR